MKLVESLLKSGITVGVLAKQLNSIPLVGMDFAVYSLSDGNLAIPLYGSKNAKVTKWKLVLKENTVDIDFID